MIIITDDEASNIYQMIFNGTSYQQFQGSFEIRILLAFQWAPSLEAGATLTGWKIPLFLQKVARGWVDSWRKYWKDSGDELAENFPTKVLQLTRRVAAAKNLATKFWSFCWSSIGCNSWPSIWCKFAIPFCNTWIWLKPSGRRLWEKTVSVKSN